ncbi:MAG: 2-oxoacid:acceptor oxidoreductase subunit alpha [Planctomycetota bacterium]
MPDPIVNDFSLRIATANGTGSQTSNMIIFRSLFHMGLAASAKNLFPSNISGLPTWYQLRVSPQGHQGRKESWEVLLALNPATLGDDLAELPRGGVVIDNADLKTPAEAFDGSIRYPVPFDTLARKEVADARLRPKLKNLIYVGVVAELFGLEHESIRAAIESMFSLKREVVESNWAACKIGIDYARECLEKRDPYRFERAQQTEGRIFIDGNEAAALGVIFGGCTVIAWYPITPATSLAESMVPHLHRLRTDEDGRRIFSVVQAEDEIAAIGIALGAGWAGARAMTSTSGPGISLMSENLGFGYYAEIPCVVFDVQRVGPSTGLPTRTQQSDILQVAFHSHGDTRFPMLFPADIGECFQLSWRAFDIAERHQIPVVVMSDLDLAMNTWVGDPFEYPDRPIDRGKLLTDDLIRSLDRWGRYLDIDGDGIPYRTVPGLAKDPRAAHLTRGSGHNEAAEYSEDDGDYQRNLDRIARKVDGLIGDLPEPVLRGGTEGALGVIAYGSSDAAVVEALADRGDSIPYLRLRAFPFHEAVGEFLRGRERILVVEQNQQGQLAQLLRMSYPESATKIDSACYYGGLPLSAAFVGRALADSLQKV